MTAHKGDDEIHYMRVQLLVKRKTRRRTWTARSADRIEQRNKAQERIESTVVNIRVQIICFQSLARAEMSLSLSLSLYFSRDSLFFSNLTIVRSIDAGVSLSCSMAGVTICCNQFRITILTRKIPISSIAFPTSTHN